MKKHITVWLIVGLILVLVGCLFFGGVMMALKWDFAKLSTNTFQTKTHDVADTYSNISIVADTADITFVPTDDGTSKVVCYEEENLQHKVTVQNDTLTVQVVNEKKWYEYIGVDMDSPAITVYMPVGTYSDLEITIDTGDVDIARDFTFESVYVTGSTGDVCCYAPATEVIHIQNSTGDIDVKNVSTDALVLITSTGKVTVSDVNCTGDMAVTTSTGKSTLTNVTCSNFVAGGSTGELLLNSVIAQSTMAIARTTGDVFLEACDAAEMFVKTDTGDVKGSLLTEKVFIAKTDTGRINVPQSTTGGKCEIVTGTGDIYITPAE